jgi:hypothetical protein
VRQKIDGLPEFIFHDLRHYLTARAHHSRRLRALMAGHDESIGADKIDAHYAPTGARMSIPEVSPNRRTSCPLESSLIGGLSDAANTDNFITEPTHMGLRTER